MAMVMARRIVAIVAPCLREEEQGDALVEIYAVVKMGLERFEGEAASIDRLGPGRN
jgi:hypothetical protein